MTITVPVTLRSNQSQPLNYSQLDGNLLALSAGIATAGSQIDALTSNVAANYAQTTGANASGTWNINVTGNAATATSANLLPQYAPRGNAVVMTGRTGISGTYSYCAYIDPNAPTGFFSAVGFGQGAAGSVEIGASWVGTGTGVWYRALRDGIDNWYAWTRIIDAANIGAYAPSLTGAGASGTWNINVTGNAASASSAPAGALTGTTLAPGVTASSLTSVGSLTSLSVGGNAAISGSLAFAGVLVPGVTSSVTSLRAANHLIIGTVYCMGNLAAGDGGAGLYRYDSTDTTSADNGGTVIVASDGARWKLVYTGVIRAEQFGLQGTGDESAKLAAFVNSAIALPGVHHVLPPKTYSISAQLPDVNVSNVCILGAGTMVHNSSSGGAVATGTIIKWIGASGGTMWQLQSVAGASNQKITQLSIKGITLDANSLAGYCCKINSIDRSDIDIGTMNALTYGVLLQVVSTLNDACDVQNNRFRFACRQIEAPGGICVGMGGSATANISLNRFSIDAVHSNTVAVLCSNTDNNDFDLVRTYCTGSAATSINFNGGPAANQLARAERVHYLTANKPAYALGANSGFAFPARNITIFALDKENGTPDPLYDPDATINWRDDYSALPDSPWLSYTPTISTSTGSLTSYTASGRYTRRGKVCYFRISLVITTNGTGGGVLHMSLPIASSASSIYQAFAGRDFNTGNVLSAYVAASSTDCICQGSAGAYPGANGANLLIQGSYECN